MWRTMCPKPPWFLTSISGRSGSESVLRQSSMKGKVRKTCKSKKLPCPSVLNHFDQQYSEELGDLWAPARAVLLDPPSWQYGVMLNRFSSVADITQLLLAQGFSLLLPQTDVSKLPYNNASSVSNSTHQKGKGTLSHLYFSKCPPEDLSLQPFITYHASSQPHQSELPLNFPQSSLQCYIHLHPLRFPSQPHRPGQLKQYYLLNAASLLPVLALQVRDGDKVLDLCSAPGGKAVAIMQSATPDLLCCNEPDPHRREWLAKTLESFLPASLSSRVMVSAQDGRSVGQSESGFYDKGCFVSASRGKTAFTAVGKKLFLNHFPDGTGTTRAVIFSPVDELQDQYLRKDVVELKSSNSILMMCLDAADQSVLTILARVVCLAQ
ncbi:PREDICTED: putative methyltransferase NSUN3 isoform X2 [Cyprinodon variegatus]|uniref:putative methyltransferase NSUN3 isoform X2 n=1 Tax=Cyprinodon variegatus TaxID=28743 RepID=UPI0007428236|nr:PREDICTED: putative methyltransferase NSUN3 isoform X2 [Cyprinodon variegatus]